MTSPGPNTNSNKTSDTKSDALLRRIRALRAKADDSSVTEAEASLYAAKVSELLQQHNLSESTLETPDEDQEQVEADTWEMEYGGDPWRRTVCNTVAHLYFCKGYSSHTGKKGKHARSFVFVGKPHNTVVAKEMAYYLISTTVRLAKAWRKAHPEYPGSEWRHFLRACGTRIAERVWKLYKDQTAAAQARSTSGNPANLPALYADEHTLVDNFLQSIKLRDLPGQRLYDRAGTHAGRRAGDTVSLSIQIAGSRAGSRLLS